MTGLALPYAECPEQVGLSSLRLQMRLGDPPGCRAAA